MKKYRHIFFDLDRTLWDFDSNSAAALTEIFVRNRLERFFSSPEPFIEGYNRHNEILWEWYRRGDIKKEILLSFAFFFSGHYFLLLSFTQFSLYPIL